MTYLVHTQFPQKKSNQVDNVADFIKCYVVEITNHVLVFIV